MSEVLSVWMHNNLIKASKRIQNIYETNFLVFFMLLDDYLQSEGMSYKMFYMIPERLLRFHTMMSFTLAQ